MGATATSAQSRRETVRFEFGKPEEVTLKYASGRSIDGNYGPSVMFTLEDNRVMFLPPEAAEDLARFSPRPGERFIVLRGKDNGRERYIFKRTLPPQPATSPAPVPVPIAQPSAAAAPPSSPTTGMAQMYCSALISAIDALQLAQDYAQKHGLPLKFGEEDVRAAATTIFIQHSRQLERIGGGTQQWAA